MSDRSDTNTSNTYFFKTEDAADMARLINLDRLLTKGMGGALSGLPELPEKAHVLDVACGSGGWALDVAFDRPDVEVCGIDISEIIIAYANARTQSQGLSNASFGVMNILEPLDFADNTFDLVNARLLAYALESEKWPAVIAEMVRVTRPGGIIRLTESDDFGLTNSSAYEELKLITYRAFKSRYGFSVDGHNQGITFMLGPLLRNAGCEHVQLVAHAIDFSAGEDAWADMNSHNKVVVLEARPFLIASGSISEERHNQLYHLMQAEMLSGTFCGTLTYHSAWGTKPSDEEE